MAPKRKILCIGGRCLKDMRKKNIIHLFNVFVILVMLVKCTFGWSWSDEEDCGLAEKEQEEIVSMHNSLRTRECAANMKVIQEWDDGNAREAYEHAKKCTFTHPKYEGAPLKEGLDPDRLSSNIAGNVDKDFLHTIEHVWYAPQKKTFSFGDLTQKSLEESGDYVQLVWSYYMTVGCAQSWCDSLKGFEGDKAAWFMVCKYQPPMGDTLAAALSGREADDMVPYKKGNPCSQCPFGVQNCCNGLCYAFSQCPFGLPSGEGNGKCDNSDDTASGKNTTVVNHAIEDHTTRNDASENITSGNNTSNGNRTSGKEANGQDEGKDSSAAPGLTGVGRSLIALPLVAFVIVMLMMD